MDPGHRLTGSLGRLARGARARVRAVIFRRSAARELDEELRFHVDMETEKNVRNGMSRLEARRHALVAFGGVERHRETLLDGLRAPIIEAVASDVRFAIRGMRRSPGFAVVMVITMTLGVGATASIFSIANALLFRPLPVPDPDRLVSIQELREVSVATGFEGVRIPWERYRGYEERTREVFSHLGAYRLGTFALRTDQRARSVQGTLISEGYFPALGVSPVRGRYPTTDDAREVVVSHRLWQEELGGDPGAVGRTVYLDSRPFTLVAIAPAGFQGTVAGLVSDVWVPLRARSEMEGAGWAADWVAMLGRLAPGVLPERAAAAVDAAALDIPPEGSARVRGADVASLAGLNGPIRGAVGGYMGLLFGLSLLVLLIAGSNIAGALVARSSARRREIAVRLAMGVGRGRLVRQLFTESLVLFLIGGAGGVALTWLVSQRLAALRLPIPGEFLLDPSPDLRVLAFALIVTAATGLAFGIVPALQASRPDLMPALKDGAWGSDGSRARTRKLFVSAQVTLAVLLLLLATLTTRSFQKGLSMDPGFDPRGMVVATLDLAPHGYDEERGGEFYGRLMERVRNLPGVSAATASQFLLLGIESYGNDIEVDETLPGGVGHSNARWNAVEAGFVSDVGIELVAGRGFNQADDAGSPAVAIINETVAERFFPGVNPVGRAFRSVGGPALEVVGVVRNGKYTSIGEDPMAYVLAPIRQRYAARRTIQVRAPGREDATLREIETIVRQLDPNVPLEQPRLMARAIDISILPYRILARVIGLFGLVGLLLAAVGVYGVLSFQVARRTREMGIRRALGAHTVDLLRLVVGEGVTLAAVGGLAGLALGAGAAHLMRAYLLRIGPLDPPSYLGVPAVLFAVAVLASAVPARRALSIEAVRALKED